jgi:ADP-heptose:LPS heptosyltransferase
VARGRHHRWTKDEWYQRMNDKKLYNTFFQASSLLTSLFPHTGARLLDMIVLGLFGNPFLVENGLKKNLAFLKQIKKFERFLVIGDINIGDAVNLQASITALRDFFPEAEIDYVINRHAVNLIEGNPDISHVWPVFTGAPYPTKDDYRSIAHLVLKNSYDVIFNFCPIFKKAHIFLEKRKMMDCYTLASMIVQGEKYLSNNHIIYQTRKFIYKLFSSFLKVKRKISFNGVTITLSERAIAIARDFITRNIPITTNSLIVYNPDTSSPFTRIPFDLQIEILKKLMNLQCIILLGSGHVSRNIETKIFNALPYSGINKIKIIPYSMPLDAYAVLIDYADVFITGDTGLLHIGAARKYSRGKQDPLRNKTAILSIFGATPAHIYGYDSMFPNFIPANQDAPSRVYIAESPCRNITCINKMAKTCRTVRCFQFLDMEKIVLDVQSYLTLSNNS